MKTCYNRKGFTLIELLLVIAILGIAITSVFSLLLMGRTVFQRGISQQSLQADNRYFADFIERELTYASKVEILDVKPVDFLSNRRYIYAENGVIMHKIQGEEPKIILTLDGEHDSIVRFNSMTNTTFSYDIENKSKNQKYELSSEINLLNLQGEGIDSRIKGDKGTVLSYAFSANSKELIHFSFDKSIKNPTLKQDIRGRIVLDKITLFVPKDIDVSSLYPSFSHTGEEVSIADVVQKSNERLNKDYTYLEIKAEDGSIRKYTIIIEELPDIPPAVQNVRINPKDPGYLNHPELWEITTVAWDTSHLFVNDYLFISNGNGLDKSKFKWYISNTKDGEYDEIVNQTAKTFIPGSDRINKWIKVGVTPQGDNVNMGIEVLSEGIMINKDPKNALWKRIVEDLDYVYMAAERRKQFDEDRADKDLPKYEVIINIRDDIPKDNTTPFKITTDVSKLSLQIEGTGSYPTGNKGGSFVSIDLAKFIDNTDGYKVIVDAKVFDKTPGWGVMVNGTVNSNNKDNGYMFQFDPGYKSGGFVMRRNIDGQHDQSNMQFDGLGVSYGNQSESYYSHKDLINGDFKENSESGWQGYLKDYTTEITIQKQLDKSMIMRVRIWRKDNPENISNEMWYGDFGENKLNTKTFRGIAPEGDRQPKVGNSSSYRGLVRLGEPKNWEWGTMIGFRTWGSNYKVQFNNIEIEKGLSMKLETAKWLVDSFISKDNIKKESSNKLLLTFDEELRDGFIKDNIKLNSELGKITQISLSKKDPKSVIITLDKTTEAVDRIINNNNIERGSIRQAKAGDITIENGIGFKVEGKVDSNIYIPPFDENKYYKIINLGNSNVLDVEGGNSSENAKIIHYSENKPISSNQQWKLVEMEDGLYNIISRMSGKNLYNNLSNNYPIVQKNNKEEDRQKWEIIKLEEGYLIRSSSDKRKIEVSDGINLKLSEQNSKVNNNQIWNIIEIK